MHRRLTLRLTLLLLALPLFAQDAPKITASHPKTSRPLHHLSSFDLVDGTALYLELAQTLSSAQVKTGDVVRFILTEDVTMGGTVIAARGAIATATVTDARRRGRGLADGRIDLSLDSVELVDGERIPLRATQQARGPHQGEVGTLIALAPIGILDPAYWIGMPTLPFRRGDDIEIPAGTKIVAFVDGDYRLDEKVFRLPLVTITSMPSTAEVSIDGTLAGSTPLARVLPPGDHGIEIRASGFKVWGRTLTVLGGAINVAAELAPAEQPPLSPADPGSRK